MAASERMDSSAANGLPERKLQVLRAYFGSGWLFFLPYLAVYLAFWATDGPVAWAFAAYWTIHVVHFGCLILVAVHCRSRFLDPRLWFFAGIGIIFLLQGAYLEFPGDNWIHLRRILMWNHIEDFSGKIFAYEKYKTGYFFHYTLVGQLPVSVRYLALSILSALMVVLFCYQVWRFLRACGLGDTAAQLGVVGGLMFMGVPNQFHAYFATSTSALSLIGVLGALVALLTAPRYRWVLWLAGFSLAGLNHMQGIGHLTLGTAAVVCWWAQQRWGTGRVLAVLGGAAAVVLGVGILFVLYVPQGRAVWESVAGAREGGWLSSYGSFRIWDIASLDGEGATTRFLEVVTWLGLLNLAAAAVLIWKKRVLGWITLAPLVAVLYPVTATGIAWLHNYDSIITYHRYLLLILPLAATIELVASVLGRFRGGSTGKRGPVAAAAGAVIVLLVGLPDQRHWLGKLRDLGRSSSEMERLAFLDPMAEQLSARPDLMDDRVVVISDPATATFLVANLGFYSSEFRLSINGSRNPVFGRIGELEDLIEKHSSPAWTICVVVPVKEPEFPLLYSPAGDVTRHWRSFAINESHQYDADTARWCETNLTDGWESFDLEPWHRCYVRKGKRKK